MTTLANLLDKLQHCSCFSWKSKGPHWHCGKRFYSIFLPFLTASTTLTLIVCIFSDYWEIVQYDLAGIANETALLSANQGETCLSDTVAYLADGKGLLIKMFRLSEAPNTFIGQQATIVSNRSSSAYSPKCDSARSNAELISGAVVMPENGGLWRTCLSGVFDEWTQVVKMCHPHPPRRCIEYLGNMDALCCKRCLYSMSQLDDMDDEGLTPYGTHYAAMSFAIVSMILQCVCYLLILIVLFKGVITVVMMTGILFLISGTFLAFALAANSYKVTTMNKLDLVLPHVTAVMAKNRSVCPGWSVTIGWSSVMLSGFSCLMWIKYSYHLATCASPKVKPVAPMMSSSGIGVNRSTSNGPTGVNQRPPLIKIDSETSAHPPGGYDSRPWSGVSQSTTPGPAGRMVRWARRRLSSTTTSGQQQTTAMKTTTQNGGLPHSIRQAEGLV